MTIDQPGADRAAMRVDRHPRIADVTFRQPPHGDDPPALGDDRVGVENGILELTGQHQPDVADDELARLPFWSRR